MRVTRRVMRISPLTLRILAVNMLALAILVVGLLYLGQYQDNLIQSHLEALKGDARVFAGMVAEGGTVVTEHTETWHWHTGEQVTLPFVSVQQLRGGQIVRWWDYWDLSTLMNAAPAWWIEDIAQGYL